MQFKKIHFSYERMPFFYASMPVTTIIGGITCSGCLLSVCLYIHLSIHICTVCPILLDLIETFILTQKWTQSTQMECLERVFLIVVKMFSWAQGWTVKIFTWWAQSSPRRYICPQVLLILFLEHFEEVSIMNVFVNTCLKHVNFIPYMFYKQRKHWFWFMLHILWKVIHWKV